MLRALSPKIYRWNACRITCVKSQYLAVNGLPLAYSAFPADFMSRNFQPCIFVPLIPFSQFQRPRCIVKAALCTVISTL